jgi:hypothetical protein
MEQPVYTIFDKLDPEWCLDQCREIIEKFPMTEKGNASGKFHDNYFCWHFHRDSQVPIVKKFIEIIDANKEKFEEIYGRECNAQWVSIAYTVDDSKEICVWHKDRYFFDGQYHITVKGNANLAVKHEDETVENIVLPNGTVWYFNGTRYLHTINVGKGEERFEICCPINQKVMTAKIVATSNDEWKHVDGTNEYYKAMYKKVAQGVEQAVERGTASNKSVHYPVNPFDKSK